MVGEQLLLLAAVVVAGIAAVIDWRTGEIPNWLSYGALALAPAAHFGLAVMRGDSSQAMGELGFSIVGAGVCAIVPLLLYRIGTICAGDVKLLAALGAICGVKLGVAVELCSFLAASTFALGRLAYQGKLWRTVGSAAAVVTNPLRKKERRRDASPEMLTEMRFGPAILVGVVCAVFVGMPK